eukprot:700968-Lingulodinium_polyedra.AAC.1
MPNRFSHNLAPRNLDGFLGLLRRGNFGLADWSSNKTAEDRERRNLAAVLGLALQCWHSRYKVRLTVRLGRGARNNCAFVSFARG